MLPAVQFFPLYSFNDLRLGTRISNALNAFFLFNLFDDAVADMLCLHTYTHGTSPKNYNSIMWYGTDPSQGGSGGESALYAAFGQDHDAIEANEKSGWNCKNRFFVFPPECPEPMRRWQPRVYSIAACIGENCSTEQNRVIKGILIFASIIQGFCSPTLKLRFAPEDPIHFEWDQTFSEASKLAAFTEEPISPDHIGLYGSLHEGLNSKWFNRVSENPTLFIQGIAKLVTTVALTALLIQVAYRYSIVATTLKIYAVIKSLQVIGRTFVPLAYNL